MSSKDRPTGMAKCFVTRFESIVCHLEVADTSPMTKATPWVQDRLIVRPVLTTGGHHPEFLADAEGAALVAVMEFLEARFGSMTEPPRPCQATEHINARVLPLAWSDELPPLMSAVPVSLHQPQGSKITLTEDLSSSPSWPAVLENE